MSTSTLVTKRSTRTHREPGGPPAAGHRRPGSAWPATGKPRRTRAARRFALPALPVVSPDCLIDRRVLGSGLAALGVLTLVALFSPTGLLTRGWAMRATELAGQEAWAWSALAVAAGAALLHGQAVRQRSITGRLAGAALLLAAVSAIHQLAVAPPAERVAVSEWLGALRQPGVAGYVGLAASSALVACFGVRGAAAVLVLLAATGLVALCGWGLATWQWVARAIVLALVQVARFGHWLLGQLWAGTQWLSAALATAAGAGRQQAARLAAALRAWRIRRAIAAAERAAAAVPASAVGGSLVPAEAAVGGGAAPAEPEPRPAASPNAVGLVISRVAEPIVPPSSSAAGCSTVRWQLPPTSLLSATTAQQISEAEIQEKCRLIERTLGAFNVPVTVKEARVGPTVTQFSLRPAEGVSVKKIKMYEADLQLVLAAKTLRIELPVPGRPVVGIEIPNSGIATVGLREVLESPQFREAKGKLRLALGRDIDGMPRVGDLARMPHLLIAGQTGSGKSGCVNSIIASLLFQCTPDELNLIMIDPKMVEMAQYEDIPHLKYPVVVDLAEAGKVLLWVVEEMERRYKLMHDAGYRHIDAYNKAIAPAPGGERGEPFPYLVVIIDELADLMMFAPDDVEPAICRLTAKARAVGIHLVVATQRPSVDVVTGLIKANMPSRIAFAVSSQTDSRVILDMGGAESLLGRGDMLYLPYDQGKPVRVQGTWVNDDEIAALVHFWKKQGSPQYVQKEEIEALALKHEAAESERQGDKQSALIERSLAVLQGTSYVSVSYLSRKLGIGYPRAARLMDELEERGYVEPEEGNGRSYRVLAGALAEPPENEP
jgi:S-DNA-T family DNA segregation ATPase FtsK/SpoIIIE